MFSGCARGDHRVKPAIAIVGSGHWWVASDRVGPTVLEKLEGRYGAGVQIMDIGTSAFALLECLDKQDFMLIVDACAKGGAPGDIHVTRPDLEAPVQDMPSLHQIGPLETLMVAQHLYPQKLPKALFLILVETEGLDASKLDSVCQEVVSIIDGFVENPISASRGIACINPTSRSKEGGETEFPVFNQKSGGQDGKGR